MVLIALGTIRTNTVKACPEEFTHNIGETGNEWEGKTEAQREKVPCPNPHSRSQAKMGLAPIFLAASPAPYAGDHTITDRDEKLGHLT